MVFGDKENSYINAVTVADADAGKYSYNQEAFPNSIYFDGVAKYNIFGKSIDETGSDLVYKENFMGYYLAFPGFFETLTIY